MNTPYTEFSRVAVESATRLSKLSLESAERVIALQVGFAKESLTQATSSAYTVAGAKDVQELLALRAVAVESAMSRLIGYSRSLYEVATDAQAQFSQLAGERFSGIQKAAAVSVDSAVKTVAAPARKAIKTVKARKARKTRAKRK